MQSCIPSRSPAWRQILKLRRFLPLAILVCLVSLASQLLYDVEWDGADVTENGLAIFVWLRPLLPSAQTTSPIVLDPNPEVFPEGLRSVDPHYVHQGTLADCMFLASLASVISSDSGRQLISNSIGKNKDGSYTVSFAGDPASKVIVSPLSRMELSLYAHASKPDGTVEGLWLPILEKAYGQYRIARQNPGEHALRFLKHGIMEGRWTSAPLFSGFGASYGARDNKALELLTGKPVIVLETTDWAIGDFGLGKHYVTPRQIMSWFRRPQVIKNFLDEQHGYLTEMVSSGAVGTATCEISSNTQKVGLRHHHAYAVFNYDCVNKILTLYDPYGNSEYVDAQGNRHQDGLFTLSLPEFNRYFTHLELATGPKPDPWKVVQEYRIQI